MKKSILMILLSIFVLSCNSDDDNSDKSKVDFTTIANGNLYGVGEEGISEQNLVITNQTAWNDLIAKMNSLNNVSDEFTETEIDFSVYTIIAVFDEIKENGGHELELDIKSYSKNIIVNVTDLVPDGNVTNVITQPFYIAKIKKTDLPIIFE